MGHNICLRIVILIITLFSHLLSKSFLTFQTEEEEGVVSFDEVSAPQSVVGDEATCSKPWASIVITAIRLSYFRAHNLGIIPEELSTWRENMETQQLTEDTE